MTIEKRTDRPRQIAAAGLLAVFLFVLVALPASASVNALRNAFNPRGFFVTLKDDPDHPQWLRSPFNTGFYRAGEGGQGNGGGNGSNEEKDDLGHSNVTYSGGEEYGIDYIDASDVDTIYSTYDHNPTPGKNFMIGYFKDEQAAQLEAIPDFTQYIGTPGRGSATVTDPSGGRWWNIPIKLTLGEEHEDGSRDAMMPGTLYEFAFLRGSQANNGTTCVLMPGDEPGTYKGYLYNPNTFTEEERAIYEEHKYDEYEFITAILPEGSSSDATVDHTIESVPMRYRIQTYADLKSWNEAPEKKEADELLASVTEADYASGKYVRENVTALQNTLDDLNKEAEEEVRYQLQKDAEWTIQQMLEDLKAALETAKQPKPVVNFDKYNTALTNAETLYNEVKDKTGTEVGQYRKEPVDALKAAIDHAKSTISGTSTQLQVDAETAALDEATMNALDALVTPPDEIVYMDAATGIMVMASRSSLPESARLAVREVVSGSAEYNEMVARVSPKPDAVAIYRIVFFDGQDVVDPTAPVTVQIPIQDQFDQTAPQVYYLDDAASPGQVLDATSPEGYRIFTTQQLGTFALAGQKQNTPEQPTQTPTQAPTRSPTQAPTQSPTQAPTQSPTQAPTRAPTNAQNPTHSTTRSTTRATQRTTRILRTTRDNRNNVTQNEITSTSVRRTQAAQPTTMTTTSPPSTTANDTSDLEQDADQHTLLFIALAVAAVGIGTGAYQLVKDQRENKNDDNSEDMQL